MLELRGTRDKAAGSFVVDRFPLDEGLLDFSALAHERQRVLLAKHRISDAKAHPYEVHGAVVAFRVLPSAPHFENAGVVMQRKEQMLFCKLPDQLFGFGQFPLVAVQQNEIIRVAHIMGGLDLLRDETVKRCKVEVAEPGT